MVLGLLCTEDKCLRASGVLLCSHVFVDCFGVTVSAWRCFALRGFHAEIMAWCIRCSRTIAAQSCFWDQSRSVEKNNKLLQHRRSSLGEDEIIVAVNQGQRHG